MTDYEKRHRAKIREWYMNNEPPGQRGEEPTEADYQRLWRRIHTPENETPAKPLTPSQWSDAADEARRVREAAAAETERVEAEKRANLTPAESNAEIARMWRDLKRSQLVEAENNPHLRGSIERRERALADAEARLAEAELSITIEARQVELATAVAGDDDVKLAATLVESGTLGHAPGSDERFQYLLLQKKLAHAPSIDAARDIAEEILQHERRVTMERISAKRRAEAEAIQRDAPVSEVELLRSERVAAEEAALKVVAQANTPKPSSFATRPDAIDGPLNAAKQELFNQHGQAS